MSEIENLHPGLLKGCVSASKSDCEPSLDAPQGARQTREQTEYTGATKASSFMALSFGRKSSSSRGAEAGSCPGRGRGGRGAVRLVLLAIQWELRRCVLAVTLLRLRSD